MSKPYAFINEQMQTYATLKAKLGLSGNAGAKFDMLNAHIRNAVVMPGHVIIVGDDSTQSCTGEEAEMMKLAVHVRQGLRNNAAGGDGHLIKNYDFLQKLLGYTSLGIGASTGAWGNHLKGVENTLGEIATLHKQLLGSNSQRAKNAFITQRRVLFSKLETQLEGFARYGTGLKNKGPIKKMLGISTKSYLHTGEIKGYAKTLSGVAKASKLLNAGTPVGIALNIGSTALEIIEACSVGREDECTEAKYVEGAKLVGGVATGLFAGSVGSGVAVLACSVVFGIPTGGLGAIACAIVGGAVAGYYGGLAGEEHFAPAGKFLYEHRP
ncbi:MULTISPECIES: hypothetical protein [unclassified Pseudomonas]|uniref:hypothetical protein n=1 Tax=unclassified Pseudomonas TaxID=196821 RepID=UPI002ACB0C9A|nr:MULTISPECIES: hypothetical protein [unclassified Pseudomonas]MEB0041947.1 hypothetical protein [Pseudomonas sp. MH10]MEB0090453.1 hypothetical protein [Pseudomonas sp. CCI4.2]MEB0123895.1 hypothetical protein [Pseudomonas sp. CCI1.2]WPX55712.1 hypothetical protein RHM65_09220 [Pseudomonas sp. CCI4.2]WPX63138.1 hypothetical protein RHM59_19835 [Pseudomonas sp. MH10]